jgi:hypothetical protein
MVTPSAPRAADRSGTEPALADRPFIGTSFRPRRSTRPGLIYPAVSPCLAHPRSRQGDQLSAGAARFTSEPPYSRRCLRWPEFVDAAQRLGMPRRPACCSIVLGDVAAGQAMTPSSVKGVHLVADRRGTRATGAQRRRCRLLHRSTTATAARSMLTTVQG